MRGSTVIGYTFLLLTILLTAYGQVVLKWRMNLRGTVPEGLVNAGIFLFRTLCDPYVISSYVAALLASLTWMAALTKFDISFAYPFMSLAFLLVLMAGVSWFGEPLTLGKIVGVALISLGVFCSTR